MANVLILFPPCTAHSAVHAKMDPCLVFDHEHQQKAKIQHHNPKLQLMQISTIPLHIIQHCHSMLVEA